jgi:superfamily I DNA/RNA helicase
MYVAMTRAKDHLFLSYAHKRQVWGQVKWNSPSRFIDEIPQEYVKIYDVSKTNSASQSKTFNDGDRVSHKLF